LFRSWARERGGWLSWLSAIVRATDSGSGSASTAAAPALGGSCAGARRRPPRRGRSAPPRRRGARSSVGAAGSPAPTTSPGHAPGSSDAAVRLSVAPSRATWAREASAAAALAASARANASRAGRSRSCCEPVTGHPREAGRTRARLRCGSEVDRDRLLLAGRLGTAALGRRGGLLGPHADAELELDLLLDLD